jgi:hypothetical protein
MSKRLVALMTAAALLAFSAAPSFVDYHGGGHGGGGWHGGVVAGMVVTAAAGELDPR